MEHAMKHNSQFYIDGEWVDPTSPAFLDVINPATEEPIARISLGSPADVDLAVKAGRRAFPAYSQTARSERLDLLRRIISVFEARFDEVAEAITAEMGSPLWFSKQIQTDTALAHFKQALIVLKDYEYDRMLGTTRVTREPIGVCGLITPWNWPVNQIASKLAPALAAGCTVVVKPSEVAPLSPIILAEILHDAGVPKGVFNLVNGDGLTVGHAISSHPDIDMVSFTGSTRAGIQVAKDAADTVKRVCQELGGKGANIILPGANLETAISAGVMRCFTNSGQSCQAPTRMLVHQSQIDEAVEIAKATAESIVVGDPRDRNTRLGPLVSQLQYDRVQNLISAGIEEGATLVTGGLGRPRGLNCGFYVQPTIFSDVRPDMTIAQQEIFGPVLSMITYSNEDEAVLIANGTVYGLSGYVFAGDLTHAREVGARLRAGRIYLNGAPHDGLQDVVAPFGGYKQSGNGREVGVFGFEEFLESKALLGYEAS
jgi:aldehyde dehydrogenase (NAD+)